MKHKTLANIKHVPGQHVGLHTIHITNILCIWSADIMITSWDFIVITGWSKVLAEKVAWLFRWPGPERCYVVVYQAYKTENGNSSAVFIWINLGETEESMFKINGTVYDWNLITTLPHLSNVCMSSPPSVAIPNNCTPLYKSILWTALVSLPFSRWEVWPAPAKTEGRHREIFFLKNGC